MLASAQPRLAALGLLLGRDRRDVLAAIGRTALGQASRDRLEVRGELDAAFEQAKQARDCLDI